MSQILFLRRLSLNWSLKSRIFKIFNELNFKLKIKRHNLNWKLNFSLYDRYTRVSMIIKPIYYKIIVIIELIIALNETIEFLLSIFLCIN